MASRSAGRAMLASSHTATNSRSETRFGRQEGFMSPTATGEQSAIPQQHPRRSLIPYVTPTPRAWAPSARPMRRSFASDAGVRANNACTGCLID
jgi:hypothetical protein